MALPYKLIKSITIDGVTNGLDPDLGHLVAQDIKDNLTVTQGVDTMGATITITDPGAYYLFNNAGFFVSGSTERTHNNVTLQAQRNGGSWETLNFGQICSFGYEDVVFNSDSFIVIGESDVPVNIRAILGVHRTRPGYSSITVYKLIHI